MRAIALSRRVRESFNYPVVGSYPEGQNVWLNAKDADGRFLGGFRGEIFLEWLFVNILFVEEPERRKGIGSRLLAEGEAHAKKLGARHARLDTFDWQAPAYYPKQGYRQVLKLPNYFRGHSLTMFVKDL